MQSNVTSVISFLHGSIQLVIPIYQRNYSWNVGNCQKFWDDVVEAGSNDMIQEHFLGTILYVADGLIQPTKLPPLQIIDGQQRLTTVSLLLAALAKTVPEEGPAGADDFTRRKIIGYYLKNELETGDRQFKLLLSKKDRESYWEALGGAPAFEKSDLITANHNWFLKRLSDRNCDLGVVCKGLSKLRVVDISLNPSTDKPQPIFESINSTGVQLSQADLIRNFLLMDLDRITQEDLYERYWRPMERIFGHPAYSLRFDDFMRYYMPVRLSSSRQAPALGQIYQAYKRSAIERSKSSDGLVEDLLKDNLTFANYFRAMAIPPEIPIAGGEEDKELAAAFGDLRAIGYDVVWPLMLELYDDYKSGVLSKGDFLEATRLVESYLARRAICSIPSNSQRNTFLTITRCIDKLRYLDSLKAEFQLLPENRRFPDDEEFNRELLRRNLYNFWFCPILLQRLENLHHKEPVAIGDYTIEHIMPQNENLSKAWRDELGPEWKRVRDTWLHTLGNLTLTGYNSKYSDKPFAEKRDMPDGFKESHLALNKGLGLVEQWDEAAIMARGKRLVELAVKTWPAPGLSPEALEEYCRHKEAGERKLAYYSELMAEPVRSLFLPLRQAILDLDPVITVVFFDAYVSFKAETDIASVSPGSGCLRMVLNAGYGELDDPRSLAKTVDFVGKLGVGDVSVDFSSPDDLPYIMKLVRQVFGLRTIKGSAD